MWFFISITSFPILNSIDASYPRTFKLEAHLSIDPNLSLNSWLRGHLILYVFNHYANTYEVITLSGKQKL